jgi:hypothetical protein
MEKDEMDFWHNQNTMSNEDINNGNFRIKKNFKFYKDNFPSFEEEIEEKTNEKTHGSNGGLSDGSDSWKYGG